MNTVQEYSDPSAGPKKRITLYLTPEARKAMEARSEQRVLADAVQRGLIHAATIKKIKLTILPESKKKAEPVKVSISAAFLGSLSQYADKMKTTLSVAVYSSVVALPETTDTGRSKKRRKSNPMEKTLRLLELRQLIGLKYLREMSAFLFAQTPPLDAALLGRYLEQVELRFRELKEFK